MRLHLDCDGRVERIVVHSKHWLLRQWDVEHEDEDERVEFKSFSCCCTLFERILNDEDEVVVGGVCEVE